MTQHPFPKKSLRVCLLEGVHESAERAFRDAGYSDVTRLTQALRGDDLRRVLQTAHVIGVRSRTQLDRVVLQDASHLFAIGCFCIGTNQVDLATAAAKGVPVFNAPHSNTRSVAELVMGLVIMLMRDIFQKSQAAHEGNWRKTASGATEVRGKTLGIVGYGHIGSQVSILAESLGLKVLYFDIEKKLPLGNAQSVPSLESLLSLSDVVTLHVPQTDQTRWMMAAEQLKLMKKGSYLINASRGTVVDIDVLADLLKQGHLKGAAVDVFPEEPKSNEERFVSPLQGMPQVILTPHIGGSTLEAQQNIGTEVAEKLVQYSDYGSTQGSVNFPQLTLAPHFNAHRILHIHHNVPGVLRRLNEIIAENDINIVGQHLQTDNQIGYVVLDVEGTAPAGLLDSLRSIDATIRARILY